MCKFIAANDSRPAHCSPVWEDCPECGGEMLGPNPFYDGDLVHCGECGFQTGITVNDDGTHYLQETNDGC